MNYEARTFSDYTPDAITAVLRELSQQVNNKIVLSACFAALQQSQIKIQFHRGGAIDFICPQQFDSQERRDFYTNRWMSCWQLFAAVKVRYPDLIGSCSLWVDDYSFGPGLSFCGNNTSNVLIPDCAFFQTDGYSNLREFCQNNWHPWRERKNLCYWRGTSTGSRSHLRGTRWQDLPRMALCLSVKQLNRPDIFDVGISRVAQIHDPDELSAIQAEEIVKAEVPSTDFMGFRMGIDIDGNTCSWQGLFCKLIMGVTTLKVNSEQGWRQWYYNRLLPWKNFVPIAASLDDLAETVCYLADHPGEAERIAEQGREVATSLTMASVMESSVATVFDFVNR